jgi:hypothetical protein
MSTVIKAAWDARIARLVARLPEPLRKTVAWLRHPPRRWLRLAAGVGFVIGGFLAILPVFGLWMLPVGLVLLAEDVPPLRRGTGRVLEWIERRRPHWMGLPRSA